MSPFLGVSFALIGMRVSAAAVRGESVEGVVRVLRESGRFGWLALQVVTNVEPETWEFSAQPGSENEVLLRVDERTDWVSVAIDAAIAPETPEEAEEARLVLELAAQQVAQLVHRRELAARNAALADEARVTREQVALAKFMDRAKSLIVTRRGLSADEAEEWLLGASIRHQKPLLRVAQEIVTALSNPSLAA